MAGLPNDLLNVIGTYATFRVTTMLFTLSPVAGYSFPFWRNKCRYEAHDALIDPTLITNWPEYYLTITRTFFGQAVSIDGRFDPNRLNIEPLVFLGIGESHIISQTKDGTVRLWEDTDRGLTSMTSKKLPTLRRVSFAGSKGTVGVLMLTERGNELVAWELKPKLRKPAWVPIPQEAVDVALVGGNMIVVQRDGMVMVRPKGLTGWRSLNLFGSSTIQVSGDEDSEVIYGLTPDMRVLDRNGEVRTRGIIAIQSPFFIRQGNDLIRRSGKNQVDNHRKVVGTRITNVQTIVSDPDLALVDE